MVMNITKQIPGIPTPHNNGFGILHCIHRIIESMNGNNIVTLSPNAADGIFGEIANAAQDSAPSGANGKDLVNTKATAIKGDRVTLVANGDADWFVIEGVGIWASEV